MNRQVSWRQPALDDLTNIARQNQRTTQRIVDAINRLAEHNIGDVKKLSGATAEYRLRVGDWRILFTFEDNGQTVLVLRVLNRRDAYR